MCVDLRVCGTTDTKKNSKYTNLKKNLASLEIMSQATCRETDLLYIVILL